MSEGHTANIRQERCLRPTGLLRALGTRQLFTTLRPEIDRRVLSRGGSPFLETDTSVLR
jgi:hypothetical protein